MHSNHTKVERIFAVHTTQAKQGGGNRNVGPLCNLLEQVASSGEQHALSCNNKRLLRIIEQLCRLFQFILCLCGI